MLPILTLSLASIKMKPEKRKILRAHTRTNGGTASRAATNFTHPPQFPRCSITYVCRHSLAPSPDRAPGRARRRRQRDKSPRSTNPREIKMCNEAESRNDQRAVRRAPLERAQMRVSREDRAHTSKARAETDRRCCQGG